MSIKSISINLFSKLDFSLILKIAFFFVSFFEIIAEYFKSDIAIWVLKPFLMPLLIALYVVSSKEKSSLYILALVLNWLANLFFISKEANFVFLASLLFIFYRTVLIFKVYKEIKIPFLSILLGSIPFFFVYISLINIVFDSMNSNAIYIATLQCLLMTVLGGYTVGYYFLTNDNESSRMFLISSLFFAVNLFLLGMKFYFFDYLFLKSLSVVFFVFGQYTFFRFVIMLENNRIIKKIS